MDVGTFGCARGISLSVWIASIQPAPLIVAYTLWFWYLWKKANSKTDLTKLKKYLFPIFLV